MSLSLFNILRQPMNSLSNCISELVQVMMMSIIMLLLLLLVVVVAVVV